MPSPTPELSPLPRDSRARKLWLQHAAGFILFEDVRRYAASRVDAALDEDAKRAVLASIDEAVYGLMMVADGVSGRLANPTHSVELKLSVVVREGEKVVEELNLADGDGMCMGFHGWVDDDFGAVPVVRPRKAKKASAAMPAWMKPRRPSAALAEVIGKAPVARTEAVSKLWKYFERKRLVRGDRVLLDAKLKPLYGKGESIHLTDVPKVLARHLRAR